MLDKSSSNSQCKILIEKQDITSDLQASLREIVVESSLHLPDVAVIKLLDAKHTWIDDDRFSPGKSLEIQTEAPSGPSGPIFSGEIVELEPEFRGPELTLVIRAFDRMHRLSRDRQTRTFLNMTDSDVFEKMAKESSLTLESDKTSQVHDYLLQANETNYQFMMRRCTALGYTLYVKEKVLHFKALKSDESPVKLEWLEGLDEFRPRLSTLNQVNKVVARGWDPDKKQPIMGQAEKGKGGPEIGEKEGGGELAKKAFSADASDLFCARPLRTQAEAEALAQGLADLHESQFVQAEGVAAGNPEILAGRRVEVSGIGKRFSGSYFVTTARHIFAHTSGYVTHFEVSGLHPNHLINQLVKEGPSGIWSGVVVGIVTEIEDPKGQGRVKIQYPWLSVDHTSYWARVASPGGGATRGIEFLPEVGDEVLVGFEMGDIQYPYVLGGLWNEKDSPPAKSAEAITGGKVTKRVIWSRTGHKIVLDDTDGSGGITIQDSGGNKIELKASSGNLTMEVKGDFKIKASGKVSIEGNTVEIKGSMIDLN